MSSLVIAKNVLIRICKQVTIIIFLVVFPIMSAILGALTNKAIDPINIGIVVTAESKDLTEHLNKLPEYNVVNIQDNEADKKLRNNIVKLVIKPVSDPYKYEIISSNSGSHVSNLENQLKYYVKNKSIYSISKNKNVINLTSVSIFLLFMIMFMGSSAGIIYDDKHNKTFMRLFCFATNGKNIAFGYLLAFFCLGLTQIFIFVVLLKLLLASQIALNALKLFIILTAFLVAIIGLCIALTSVIKRKDQCQVIVPILALFSTFVAGGIIPLSSLGKGFKIIAYFSPQYYVNISLLNNTITSTATNIAILLLFALVFFSFGTALLDKENL